MLLDDAVIFHSEIRILYFSFLFYLAAKYFQENMNCYCGVEDHKIFLLLFRIGIIFTEYIA